MSRLTVTEEKLRNEMWSQGQLWCSACKQFKPAKQFYKWRADRKQGTNYGYRYYCIECENSRKRNKIRLRSYYQDRNKGLKRQVVDLGGGCCQRCGYDEFASGMDFHHVYPAEKKADPMTMVYSKGISGSWNELDKCCLLCRNCHNAYKASEWRAEFVKRDGLGWAIGRELPLDDNRYEVAKVPEYQQAMLPDAYREVRPVQMTLLERATAVYKV